MHTKVHTMPPALDPKSPMPSSFGAPQPCSQCGKPAILAIITGGHPLCVHCYYTVEVARTLGFSQLTAPSK